MTSARATGSAARQGRETLATALLSLQTSGIVDARIERAVEATAAASSALYSAEAVAPTDEAALSFIHSAVESLQRAVADVSLLRPQHSELEVAGNSLARTLAVLYPVLQHSLRQRRARLPAGGLSAEDARELRTMSAFPRAPAPTGRERRPSALVGGRERRTSGNRRVFVEVEIGLTTESHIYTGLSLDVSTGGVFVATYDVAAPGTAISLHFVLPDGFVVNAEGVVRWTRAATTDAPPGMGVAFTSISVEALDHIAAFCASRPPLYFDE
ncbi:MAG TPA: TIGR02266 family protein [Polyangiaceae bacterium]|nr:TIGR02266 family protein [Polyangiaceae bacterium]